MRWTITSGWAETDAVHPLPHTGIDFGLPLDTPIRVFESGTVTKVLHEGTQSFGNSVWIKFNDGYTAVYGHLDKVRVKVGERVYTDEQIALSGNTGRSTGPHLHLGIMDPHGKWIDPSHYVRLNQVSDPKIIYGSGDWAGNLVGHWFDQVGEALGNGLSNVAHSALVSFAEHLPVLVGFTLVCGGFLKMVGSNKWSSRLFVGGVVGAAWLVLF